MDLRAVRTASNMAGKISSPFSIVVTLLLAKMPGSTKLPIDRINCGSVTP
jgi:hypothetical protein